MTEPFAEIVGPYFRAVIALQQGFERGEHPALDEVRLRLLTLLSEAEQKASRSNQLAHDFALSRHALVYWTDEVLIDSPGGGGYGDPLERDRERLRRDVEEGFVSDGAARALYGWEG